VQFQPAISACLSATKHDYPTNPIILHQFSFYHIGAAFGYTPTEKSGEKT